MAKRPGGSPDWADGFMKSHTQPKPRIIGLSVGEVGSGKTAFWLSAPGPIAFFDMGEYGTEGVIEDFQAHKDIYIKNFEWSPIEGETTQAEARDVRDAFMADFELAVQNARTVIIDKETQLYEIFRYAEFGGPSAAPKDYAALHQKFRRLMSMAKATSVNLGLIEGMKDQWASVRKSDGSGTKGSPTGLRIRKGFDEADELVHIVLTHERADGMFQYTVGKSRGPGGHEVQDQTFVVAADPEEKLTAFAEFAMKVFPDSTSDDWV